MPPTTPSMQSGIPTGTPCVPPTSTQPHPPLSSSPLTRFFFPVPPGALPLQPQERRVVLREWFRIARLPGIAARLGLTLLLGIVCFWIAVTAVFLVSDNGGGQWFHAFFNEALGVQVFTPTTPTTPAISTTSTLSPILADLLRRIVQFCLGLPYLALSVRAAHRKTIAQRERILIDRTTTCAHCGYPINRTTNPLCPECGTPTSPTSPNTSTTQ